MTEPPETCEVCGEQWRMTWTDSHGIAQCCYCGASYRLYHYDENNKREDKPPECTLNLEGREAISSYYAKAKRPVPAQTLGYSFPGGQSAATREDAEAWVEHREAMEEA